MEDVRELAEHVDVLFESNEVFLGDMLYVGEFDERCVLRYDVMYPLCVAFDLCQLWFDVVVCGVCVVVVGVPDVGKLFW